VTPGPGDVAVTAASVTRLRAGGVEVIAMSAQGRRHCRGKCAAQELPRGAGGIRGCRANRRAGLCVRVGRNEMSDAGYANHIGSQPILDATIRVRHTFVLTQMLGP
jgi:hypothetical protein